MTIISLLFFFNLTCTEPFDFETNGLENILVVEGNITDEVSIKEISLSRAFNSGQEVNVENGAEVLVEDDQGNTYQFEEQGDTGNYLSVVEFSALRGRNYRVKITTVDSNSYSSSAVSLPPASNIRELKAVRTAKSGVDGVAILVSSQGNNGEPGFYRYIYEETYQIVSFFSPTKELIVVSENPPELELIDKTREEDICYKTINSNAILVANADNLVENVVNEFQLRFIERLSREITSRYSILVKQFSQSRDANTYFRNLKEFSSIENLFTQTQPGFIPSNISSDTNANEKVLGFFEISSVSSKRIFFDFQDVFGNATRFFPDCEILDIVSEAELFKAVSEGAFDYASETISGTPLVAPIACVDCNVLGSNVVPDFWED